MKGWAKPQECPWLQGAVSGGLASESPNPTFPKPQRAEVWHMGRDFLSERRGRGSGERRKVGPEEPACDLRDQECQRQAESQRWRWARATDKEQTGRKRRDRMTRGRASGSGCGGDQPGHVGCPPDPQTRPSRSSGGAGLSEAQGSWRGGVPRRPGSFLSPSRSGVAPRSPSGLGDHVGCHSRDTAPGSLPQLCQHGGGRSADAHLTEPT